MVAPSWIFHDGVFAWNGVIAWWINVAVFGLYTGAFIVLLRNMILREDFGTGPLPDLARRGRPRSRVRGVHGAMTTTATRGVAGVGGGSPQHIPGGRDIWFFVLFESLIFTSYFCVYLFNRTQHEQAFLLGQSHLLLWLGVLDTIVLLTSSWAMARCVQHARAGRIDASKRAALLTAGLGVVFLLLKVVGVGQAHPRRAHLHQQRVLPVLLLLDGDPLRPPLDRLRRTRRALVSALRSRIDARSTTVETCATYWHTVDFFWVLIFALLYVVR